MEIGIGRWDADGIMMMEGGKEKSELCANERLMNQKHKDSLGGAELFVFHSSTTMIIPMSASTESSPVSSPEINPFDSFLSSSYPVEELFLERPLVKSSGRPQRSWLPDFKEQVDKGITFYDLTVPHDARSHTVRVNLEFRKNSTGSDLWDASLVLALYLGTPSPETFKNKNIVELGSGSSGHRVLLLKILSHVASRAP